MDINLLLVVLMLIVLLAYVIIVLVLIIPTQRELYLEIRKSDERFLKAWSELKEDMCEYEAKLSDSINSLKE